MTCWHQRSVECTRFVLVTLPAETGFSVSWLGILFRLDLDVSSRLPRCANLRHHIPYTIQHPTTNECLAACCPSVYKSEHRILILRFGLGFTRVLSTCYSIRLQWHTTLTLSPNPPPKPPSSSILFKIPWTRLLANDSDANAQPPGLGSHSRNRFKPSSNWPSTLQDSIPVQVHAANHRELSVSLTPFNGIIINIPAEPTYPRPNFLPSAQEFELGRSHCKIFLCPTTRSLESYNYRISSERESACVGSGHRPPSRRAILGGTASWIDPQCRKIQYPTCFELEEQDLSRTHIGDRPNYSRIYGVDMGIPAAMPPSCMYWRYAMFRSEGTIRTRVSSARLKSSLVTTRPAVCVRSPDQIHVVSKLQLDLVQTLLAARRQSIELADSRTAANAVASRAGYGERPPPPERIRAFIPGSTTLGGRSFLTVVLRPNVTGTGGQVLHRLRHLPRPPLVPRRATGQSGTQERTAYLAIAILQHAPRPRLPLLRLISSPARPRPHARPVLSIRAHPIRSIHSRTHKVPACGSCMAHNVSSLALALALALSFPSVPLHTPYTRGNSGGARYPYILSGVTIVEH
ncbi:hypothetical protein C8R43DRAFT_1135934 [Mycena crocata]|nr:hypothetical protein C8R43DRAFT_1135934 [Mycena crocata]